MHRGTSALVGRPDASCGDQSAEGKCLLGCVIGLTSWTLSGPRNILQCASTFARKLVKFSEMIDHESHMREFCEPPVDFSAGMVGFAHCKSLSAHPKHKGAPAEKYLVRHVSGTSHIGARAWEIRHMVPFSGDPSNATRHFLQIW